MALYSVEGTSEKKKTLLIKYANRSVAGKRYVIAAATPSSGYTVRARA